MALSTRNRRPQANASDTKSSDQRWLGSCGIAIGTRVPSARFRPPRLRTVSRSSRYSRYTFFKFMPLPSRLSRITSRR